MSAQPLSLLYNGKVRDVYDAGDNRLLMVASDRISAFDVILTQSVPDKGKVLTALSTFWFDKLADIAPSHLISVDQSDFPAGSPPESVGRAMLVRRAEMLPLECIVRGYITGSAWKEYVSRGTMHGEPLPSGLREAERLSEPMFTPSTKAGVGHDENISVAQAAAIVGSGVVQELEKLSLALYSKASEWAADRGIILADTKLEFGLIDGQLSVCDEIFTPDSSRFWDLQDWMPGATPPSMDKQPVRDWLSTTGWDQKPPPPSLPQEVVSATRERYVQAYERLSGLHLEDWPTADSS